MNQPWSQRFTQPLHPLVERFNASIGFDLALLPWDVRGSQAHARMLARQGIITPEEGETLVQGLAQILQEYEQGRFPAQGEDVHLAVEQRLTELVGEVGKKLHTARSRNDQVATDLRLYLRDAIDDIAQRLRQLQRVLCQVAADHVETLMPGYTHLQRAQPVSLAHHLLAYFEMFQRDRQRLQEVRRRVNCSPLGAGALAGTTFPIDRHYTAALLGFEAVCANSLDAVSDRDFVVEFLAAASLILVHLSRMAEELILWSSQEFGFIEWQDSCATGSSMMPQKKNPDVPELVRGKAGRVFGHLQALLVMLKGLPLAYNKDLQEDKEALFDTVKTVQDCLAVMTLVWQEGVVINQDRLAAAVATDWSNATDVADYLAAKGVPFREAYQITGQIVRFALEQGRLLQDLRLEEWQQFHPHFAEDIYEVIRPEQVVARRRSLGGTGFDQVRAALAQAQRECSDDN
ncbi:MAG: argininosuccinate lyase [Gloeomargarita sp. SKYG116]|nr:argininosuccinate lyase [Gloeomargarita sp. SKYG116]MDW8400496.1 argininosuccinate lyase [Gloeomargarita sp. SKYGB_i_bin116]